MYVFRADHLVSVNQLLHSSLGEIFSSTPSCPWLPVAFWVGLKPRGLSFSAVSAATLVQFMFTSHVGETSRMELLPLLTNTVPQLEPLALTTFWSPLLKLSLNLRHRSCFVDGSIRTASQLCILTDCSLL